MSHTTLTTHRESGSLPSSFRLDIQGLRALAVLAVVAYHISGLLPGGFLGVDVFFVISGFVITSLIERRWASGGFSLREFALKRFRRLAPALAVVTVITLLVSPLFTSPFQAQENLAWTALASTFWVANFSIAATTGDYFAAPAITNPLLQMWSLSVEEQLYLIFALLAIAVFKIGRGISIRKVWIASILVLTAGSFSLAVLLPSISSSNWSSMLFGFYGPLGRVWEFGIGALVALMGSRLTLKASVAGLLSAIGLGTVIGAFVWTPGTAAVPGIGSLAPVLGTALLIWAGGARNPISAGLHSAPLVFIGDRSYSIYLWHWPFIVWVATFSDSVPVLAAAAAVSLIPAFASYRFIENPLRHRARWTPRQSGALISLCLGAPTLAAFGLLFASRNNYGIAQVAYVNSVISQPHASNFLQCYSEPLFQGPSGRCFTNATALGRPIYLIGDSNADHLSEAVIGAGEILDRPAAIAYQNNCAILQPEKVSSDPGACMSFVSQLFANLEALPAGTVVLSISDTYAFTQDGDGLETLIRDLRNFISDVKARGHSVVLVRSVPKWSDPYSFDPTRATLIDFISGNWTATAPADALARQGSGLWTAYQVVGSEGQADLYDPWPALCPDGTCSTYSEGQMVYSDAVHITVAQSAALADPLSQVLSRTS